jgi:hypothetical protein
MIGGLRGSARGTNAGDVGEEDATLEGAVAVRDAQLITGHTPGATRGCDERGQPPRAAESVAADAEV